MARNEILERFLGLAQKAFRLREKPNIVFTAVVKEEYKEEFKKEFQPLVNLAAQYKNETGKTLVPTISSPDEPKLSKQNEKASQKSLIAARFENT